MYQVIIFGTGKLYNDALLSIKVHESTGAIKVVGIVSSEISTGRFLDGYRVISLAEIQSIEYDYCLFARPEKEIENALKYIPREKNVPIRVLHIPYFNFADYIRLKTNPVSIIAANCWAGFCYHYLGLEFTSPTINMWIDRMQFADFVDNLEQYLQEEVVEVGIGKDNFAGKTYPIARVGDITLHMNHYATFEEGKAAWEKRKTRVNFENLLVISASENVSCVERFCRCKAERKYIFVPADMEMQGDPIVPIEYKPRDDGSTIAMYANGFANGALSGIDILAFISGDRNWNRAN